MRSGRRMQWFAACAACAMLGQLHEFDKAEDMFRAAVRLRPEAPEAYNNLGLALAGQGKFNDAAYNFAKAVELKPDYSDAQQNLAKARQRLPKTTSAP